VVRVNVYRWDLDRTYLDTDIHSVRGMIRTAFEGAGDKRNIPGSAALIRALREADPQARIHVLSGSPTQMRTVLQEKLSLDGIRVDRMVLKDNLRNLRRGRLRAVRGQVGFKLPTLLAERAEIDASAREILFGDDSEADAVIYSAYGAAVAGRIGEKEVVRLLTAGEAYPDAIEIAVAALREIARAPAVEAIFINLDRRSPLERFQDLPGVIPVFSWFQAAVVLWDRGRVTSAGMGGVAAACAAEARLGESGLVGLVQDLARRGVVEADRLQALATAAELAPLRPLLERALSRIGAVRPVVPDGALERGVGAPDFAAALARTRREPARPSNS
jgi:hypothetical protein